MIDHSKRPLSMVSLHSAFALNRYNLAFPVFKTGLVGLNQGYENESVFSQMR